MAATDRRPDYELRMVAGEEGTTYLSVGAGWIMTDSNSKQFVSIRLDVPAVNLAATGFKAQLFLYPIGKRAKAGQ